VTAAADNPILRRLPVVRRGVREVLIMWESIVGFVGIVLIVYLLVAIIRPEKF
jgi:K+-transporting ATPase KdpF subunit